MSYKGGDPSLHHKTRSENCKGVVEEGKQGKWLYWCPNRGIWLVKPCDCPKDSAAV